MKEKKSDDDFSTRGPLLIMVLSLSVIFTAIISSYWRYDKTLGDYQWVVHSSQIVRELARLKSRLLETSLGIHQVTGDKKNVFNLETEFQTDFKQLQTVKSLLAGDTPGLEKCDTLNQLIGIRHLLLSKLVKEQEEGNDSLIYRDVTLAKANIDELIAAINTMVSEESASLNYRADLAEKGGRASPVFLIVASGVSVLCIALTYLMLVQAYRKQLLLQNELAQKIKDLNRSNDELEQFAYIASHDLQEPLRKLRTFGNMLQLKEKERLSDEGRDLLERMQMFGARMQHLIEDLLLFSRMVNKEPKTTMVDLNRIIADIKTTVTDANKSKEISIWSDTLPFIKGYESQLVQLFQNLVSNSVKYAKAGQPAKITISVELAGGVMVPNVADKDRNAGFYKISVTDNGIGFENEFSEKIFNIFQRLHGKAEYEGTGIGLAICKRVVENHSGYIEAKSQPGEGTTINVYLPKNGAV